MRPSTLLAAGLWCVAGLASGQEFAVETVVFAEGPGGAETVVARGVTLSHAGRIYDYCERSDSAGEVLIFDRVGRAFVILNVGLGLKAEASRDEIAKLLASARTKVSEYADSLRESNDPVAVRLAGAIDFDVDSAVVRADSDDSFSVAAGPARYEVATVSVADRADASPDAVAAYADYADSVAELSYLLRPWPILPDLRLKVNGFLRETAALPTGVRFTAQVGEPISMRTEHVFMMTLSPMHRAMITQWDAMHRDASMREIPLRRYVKLLHDAKDRG